MERQDLKDLLTPRQLDILDRMAHGQTRPEIADYLNVSLATVNRDARLTANVIGVDLMSYAVSIAIKWGWVDVQTPTDFERGQFLVRKEMESGRAAGREDDF